MTEPTELHELAEKTTPRPWRSVWSPHGDRYLAGEFSFGTAKTDDAAFIVALVNAYSDGKLRWVEEAAPATCPTCGSDKRGVRRGLDPDRRATCPDSWHDCTTPVSDEMVREALQQLRYLVNEYAPHEGVEALATIESAITRNHHGS